MGCHLWQTGYLTGDPLAFRPTLAGGLALSYCLLMLYAVLYKCQQKTYGFWNSSSFSLSGGIRHLSCEARIRGIGRWTRGERNLHRLSNFMPAGCFLNSATCVPLETMKIASGIRRCCDKLSREKMLAEVQVYISWERQSSSAGFRSNRVVKDRKP